MWCSHGTITPGGDYGPTWSVQLTSAAQIGPWACSINVSAATDFDYDCVTPDSSATAPVVIWWAKAG